MNQDNKVVTRSLNDIVNHLQFAISNVPNILELTQVCEKYGMEIVDTIYSPNLKNIGLAFKLKDKLTTYQIKQIKKLSEKQKFKILLMIENQIILKFENNLNPIQL